MPPRARTRALTALAAVALGAVVTPFGPAYAADVDPQAPVVVDDTVTLWPGASTWLDVLANDSDPGGDTLALCLFPSYDFSAPLPPVLVFGESTDDGSGGVTVQANLDARGTTTVDYYVCNHTRLTPATLTVEVRDVAPVHVVKVAGRTNTLRVTNDNDAPIHFAFGDRTGWAEDGRVTVPAHGTRTVRVRRHQIRWTAHIGRSGIADYGRVVHIPLTGRALPPPRVPHDFEVGPGPAFRHER